MSKLHRTAKHEVIQAWAASRRGAPALVKGTQDALRIRLANDEAAWEAIAWDRWFQIFDEKEFAFLFEDPGLNSKVVRRNGTEDGGTRAG